MNNGKPLGRCDWWCPIKTWL